MPSEKRDWYAVLRLAPTASAAEIAEAVELRSRQAAALATTAPERSQMLRDEVRAIKQDLLQGDDARVRYDSARSGFGASPGPDTPSDQQSPEVRPSQLGDATPLSAAGAGESPSVSLIKPPILDGIESSPPSQRVGSVTASDGAPPVIATPEPLPRGPWWADRRKAGIAIGAAAALVIAVVGISVAAASGGGSHHAAAATPVTEAPAAISAPPTEAVPATEASSEPAPTETPTQPQTFGPGDEVLSSDDINSDCGGAAPTDSASTDDTGDGSSSGGPTGQVDEILPDATVILDCSDADGNSAGLAAVAARAGTVLWTRNDLPGSGNSVDDGDVSSVLLSGGGRNIYVLQVTDHPAVDLQDEYWTRTVTAVDAHTGKDLWTKPLERADKSSDNTTGAVEEDPIAGSTQFVAIVNVDDFSGYDAQTGALIWEHSDLNFGNSDSPFLAGYDRKLDVLSTDNGTNYLSCTDLASGKQLWTAAVDDSGVVQANDANTLVGSTYWFINGSNYAAYNLLSGKVVARGAVPSSFSTDDAPLITPRYTVAQVGSTLRLYRTGDYAKPLWSVPSDGSTPQIVTSTSILVQASAGEQLLSTDDGQILQADPTLSGSQGDVNAGLIVTDGGVYEVGAV